MNHIDAIDAKAYAELDPDSCQICGAYGDDKRTFLLRCMYDMKEIAPEFLSMRAVPEFKDRPDLFYLRVCKSCRGEILDAMYKAINRRRELRGRKLDHDGYLEEQA